MRALGNSSLTPLMKAGDMSMLTESICSADIDRISRAFLDFTETPESKIFPNEAFGYWKVTVERPLRLHSQLSLKAIETLRFASGDEDIRAALYEEFGVALFTRFASVAATLEKRLAEWGSDEDEGDDEEGGAREGPAREEAQEAARPDDLGARRPSGGSRHEAARGAGRRAVRRPQPVPRPRGRGAAAGRLKLAAADLKLILKAVSWRARPRRPSSPSCTSPARPRPTRCAACSRRRVDGKPAIVEYEPDPDLRDTEQVPLLEEGGVEAFIRREVLPYTPDAWVKDDATKIGYEVSFTRHFYKPQPLRTLEEISADILAIENEAEGLLDGLLVQGA